MNYAQAAALIERFDKEYYTPTTFRQGKDALGFADPVATRESFNKDRAEKDFDAGLLTEAEYGLYGVWAETKRSDPTIRTIYEVSNNIKKEASRIEEERNTYLKDFYKKTMSTTSQQAYRVPLESAAQKDQFRPTLNALAAVAERTDGLPGFEGTADDIRLMASKLQGALVYTDSAGDYQINATNEAGESLLYQ